MPACQAFFVRRTKNIFVLLNMVLPVWSGALRRVGMWRRMSGGPIGAAAGARGRTAGAAARAHSFVGRLPEGRSVSGSALAASPSFLPLGWMIARTRPPSTFAGVLPSAATPEVTRYCSVSAL